MVEALAHLEDKYDVKITCSREEEPLGTAGPIRLAQELLIDSADPSNSFFVLNSDVICDFPFQDMLDFHCSHGKEGTVLVTKVANPSAFGVIVKGDDNKILRFVEKPAEFVSNCINAGIYIFNKSVIDRIQPRPTSIEKEIFPVMASEGQLCAFELNSFWADIGQPKEFLSGMTLYLNNLANKDTNGEVVDEDCQLATGMQYIGNVLVSPSVKIGKGSIIGPNVTLGEDCVVGDGVRISNSAIMSKVHIDSYSWIDNTIVGWKSKIGKWSRVEGLTVIGQDVHVKDECFINGAFVLPHKSISESVPLSGSIIM